MSSRIDVGDLDNSLPSWISDHLGEKSYMANEVNQLPSSPREDSPNPEGSPSVATFPPVERKTNVMTPDEVDLLIEFYSFLPSIKLGYSRRMKP